MTVLDKVREIAILRSMGYRRWDITLIFLFQGFLIATFGSLLGAGFGALLTYGISLIPIKVRGFLYTDRFIVLWNPEHYLYAALIAFFAVLTASYFPARRAANLAPVDILRGSGSNNTKRPPSPENPPASSNEEGRPLQCEKLERFLGHDEARVHVLRGVSLELERGFTHAVVGPSGCGKSSLLYILGLLDRPDAGQLAIGGRPVAGLPDDELSQQRNELLGFIFQFHFLLQDFTAQENVMIPMRQLGRWNEREMLDRAAYLLDAVGLGDKLVRPQPSPQRRRTAARRHRACLGQ